MIKSAKGKVAIAAELTKLLASNKRSKNGATRSQITNKGLSDPSCFFIKVN